VNFGAADRGAELAGQVVDGNHVAIGRAISLCENDNEIETTESLIDGIWPYTGRAALLGITGPAGVGKSTLTSGLIGHLREQGQTVGVVAVDPSSPDSGGSMLADRIRMVDHFVDSGVFIRSMSAGRHLGGLAEATFLATLVLDAAGNDVIIVETVGVGQSEVEVRSLVDTVTVVIQPGAGDEIQSMKAGLMEIPDVLCLNKHNHPESDATKRGLLEGFKDERFKPLFVTTEALEGQGLAELWGAIEQHRASLGEDGLRNRRRNNLSTQLLALARSRVISFQEIIEGQVGEKLLNDLEARTTSPLRAVDYLVQARHR